MSLPGSSSARRDDRDNGDTGMVTVMVTLAALFMLAGTIILSVWLNGFYGKFLWDIGSKQ